jgi:hypothetical protein
MKPNLVAFGKVTTSNQKKVKQSFGTSFAAPLVSGFAACVMQLRPELNNMEVFCEMEKSGHLYPYYDYAHGFGVPQASYFTSGRQIIPPTFEFSEDGHKIIALQSTDETESYSWPDGDSLAIAEFENLAETYSEETWMEDSTWAETTDFADLNPESYEYEADNESETGLWTEEDSAEIADMDFRGEYIQEVDSLWENGFDYSDADQDVYFDIEASDWESGNQTTGYNLDSELLYFHIIGQENFKIKRYALVNMQFSDEFEIPSEELVSGDRIFVYYKGYVNSFIY